MCASRRTIDGNRGTFYPTDKRFVSSSVCKEEMLSVCNQIALAFKSVCDNNSRHTTIKREVQQWLGNEIKLA